MAVLIMGISLASDWLVVGSDLDFQFDWGSEIII